MNFAEHYKSLFDSTSGELAGSGTEWLDRQRKQALKRFQEQGFPTARQEDWRYTRVNQIEKKNWQYSAKTCVGLDPEDLNPFVGSRKDSHVLVFVNGHFQPQLSTKHGLPEGVTLLNMATALQQQGEAVKAHLGTILDGFSNGFTALNTAFVNDGAYLHVAQDTQVDRPVHLLFLATKMGEAVFIQPRNLIVMEQGARAQVMETYGFIGGEPDNFTNAVTEISMAANAHLSHCKSQLESEKAYHIAVIQAKLAADANLQSHAVSLGSRLARTDINVLLSECGSHCTLNGLYMPRKRQHMDFHTFIDHAVPYCTSEEVYRGVLDDASRGVFNGKVLVREGAVKTNADQSNKNLLLSRDAEIDTKPQLEIFNDDVRCTHGATVGQLDEKSIFYLRSRGLDERAARSMLTFAFANDVVQRVDNEGQRERLSKAILNRLPGGEALSGLEQD